uniref:Uncharacterized protein n=1 Tax=Candidatus Kentrum sp. SD TaxID=2126332 RepID=A0A450YYP2_9GAMM|nr:MAG: hypothetical protein BECKSD772F_GA0070984_10372 [Candidatus Kentron sp. SD]VFK46647.1 MAG: hypothetical protein BECKSD772E_GA0070983_107722 [Candidatus Kentron sp. SD]VFK80079.1 MAG: hypothetical protein BECKSD772D_GA0070982_10842 [Candidatus Kentron sp. SD]
MLRAVRGTLVDVIRDTTTTPGSEHPLSGRTREEIRHCLDLITARQQEMAEAAGESLDERPIFPEKTSCGQNTKP